MVVFKLRMDEAKPEIMELLREERFSALSEMGIIEKLSKFNKKTVHGNLKELVWFGLVTEFASKTQGSRYGISERGLELTPTMPVKRA